jgi:hypothetical protein
MPEQGLYDRHRDASIPVARAEGVTERMPTESRNPQARTDWPQVPPEEVEVVFQEKRAWF